MGVDELLVGAEDDEPDDVEPDDVELDDDEEPDDVEEGDVVAVVPDEPDEVDGVVVVVVPDPVSDVVLAGVLEPGCSRATTTPMNAAMPVAANTAARVSVRTRAWARSLVWGVLG